MAAKCPAPSADERPMPTKLWEFFRHALAAYRGRWGNGGTAFFKLGDTPAPFTFNRDQAAVACITLRAVGVPAAIAAPLTGWSVPQARRIYDEWKGSGKISKAHGGGRRPAMTKEQLEAVVEALAAGKVNSIKDVMPSGVDAHPTTVARNVRKVVVSATYRKRRMKKKPYDLTPGHKRRRLEWAQTQLKRAQKAGRDVYVKNLSFTDSKIFITAELEPQGEWVIKLDADSEEHGQREPPSTSRAHCYKVHAYGGVTLFGFTSLITDVSGTRSRVVGGAPGKKGVDAREYQDYILPRLLKELAARFAKHGIERAWIFQHDGAPAHTVSSTTDLGKAARAIITKLAPRCIWDWPSLSPDLSLIESVWAEVVARMRRAKRSYANHNEFESHVHEIWAEISADKDYLHNLYYGNPKKNNVGFLGRLEQCVERKGGRTPH